LLNHKNGRSKSSRKAQKVAYGRHLEIGLDVLERFAVGDFTTEELADHFGWSIRKTQRIMNAFGRREFPPIYQQRKPGNPPIWVLDRDRFVDQIQRVDQAQRKTS